MKIPKAQKILHNQICGIYDENQWIQQITSRHSQSDPRRSWQRRGRILSKRNSIPLSNEVLALPSVRRLQKQNQQRRTRYLQEML